MIPKNFKGGFTVTELLLVIIITGILLGIGTPYYRSNRIQFEYNQTLIKISSLIKTARNYAITSRPYFDGTNQVVPPDGYGVYFEVTTVDAPNEIYSLKAILFANTGNDPERYDPKDAIEEVYELPKNIFLKEIIVKADPITYSSSTNEQYKHVAIIFKPPLASTSLLINDVPSSTNPNIIQGEDIKITLSRIGAGPEKISNIKMNRISGFPEIEL